MGMSIEVGLLGDLAEPVCGLCSEPAGLGARTVPEHAEPTEDPVYDAQYNLFHSHLLCHSDCEGFYIPMRFPEPLFSEQELQLPGGIIGSSYAQREELNAIARKLGIALTSVGDLPNNEAKRINHLDEQTSPFRIELTVWLALPEATRLSIQYHSAMVFN